MDAALVIAILNSTDASVGGCFDIHFADLSCEPASTLRVAILLEGVLAIKVVHPNLPTYPSDRVQEISGSTHFFPITPVDRSQRGEGNSIDGGLIDSAGPAAVQVYVLKDGATRHLAEDSKRPDPRAHDGDTAPGDDKFGTVNTDRIFPPAARFALGSG